MLSASSLNVPPHRFHRALTHRSSARLLACQFLCSSYFCVKVNRLKHKHAKAEREEIWGRAAESKEPENPAGTPHLLWLLSQMSHPNSHKSFSRKKKTKCVRANLRSDSDQFFLLCQSCLTGCGRHLSAAQTPRRCCDSKQTD